MQDTTDTSEEKKEPLSIEISKYNMEDKSYTSRVSIWEWKRNRSFYSKTVNWPSDIHLRKQNSTLWARPIRRISSIAGWNLSEFCPKYPPFVTITPYLKRFCSVFLHSIKSNNIPSLVFDLVFHSVPGEFGTVPKSGLFRLLIRGEILNHR